LLRFGRSDTAGLAPAGLLDSLIVTVVLLLLVWVTTISPLGFDAWAFADRALITYPIGDALLLATAVRLLTAGRRSPTVGLLVAGAAATLVADSITSLTVALGGAAGATGGWPLASLQDVGWLIYYACCGAAALHPSMSRLTNPEPIATPGLSLGRIWVLALTALIAPAILLVQSVLGEVRDGVALALAGSALFLLALARVATTANSHSRSLVFRDRQDTLTGLANRAHLVERLTAAQPKQWSAVMLVDVDEFRLINDDAGHSVGDAVLVAVARRLVRQLGRNDLVARFGGDEFAVLLPDLALNQARQTAERIRQQIAGLSPSSLANAVTVSIGLADRTPDDDVARLVQRADTAMYGAKEGGRNRVAVATESNAPESNK